MREANSVHERSENVCLIYALCVVRCECNENKMCVGGKNHQPKIYMYNEHILPAHVHLKLWPDADAHAHRFVDRMG